MSGNFLHNHNCSGLGSASECSRSAMLWPACSQNQLGISRQEVHRLASLSACTNSRGSPCVHREAIAEVCLAVLAELPVRLGRILAGHHPWDLGHGVKLLHPLCHLKQPRRGKFLGMCCLCGHVAGIAMGQNGSGATWTGIGQNCDTLS